MKALRNLAALIGRILMAVIFIDAGTKKIFAFPMFVALMTAHDVPVSIARIAANCLLPGACPGDSDLAFPISNG